MDGAPACYLYPAAGADAMRRRVGRRGVRDEASGASPGRTAPGADLGGKHPPVGIFIYKKYMLTYSLNR